MTTFTCPFQLGQYQPPGSRPQRRKSAEEVRKQLLEKFEQWNSDNDEKKPVPQCLLQEGQRLLLDTRMPAYLPLHDDRFNVRKTADLCLRHT